MQYSTTAIITYINNRYLFNQTCTDNLVFSDRTHSLIFKMEFSSIHFKTSLNTSQDGHYLFIREFRVIFSKRGIESVMDVLSEYSCSCQIIKLQRKYGLVLKECIQLCVAILQCLGNLFCVCVCDLIMIPKWKNCVRFVLSHIRGAFSEIDLSRILK